MELIIPLVITVLATIFAILTPWLAAKLIPQAANWNWTAASAIFTAAMTGATMWMAVEARANRLEAIKAGKRQAFKSALVEITHRNQVVVGILKGLSAKGKLIREFLTGDVQSGIEYLRDYPKTVELLQQVNVPADTFRYVLGAVHKMKGLVNSIEEEIGKAFQIKGDSINVTLRRFKYLHLILVQLGRVLVVEAKKQGIEEIQEWEELLKPSFFAGDLGTDDVSQAIAVYPPLGELRLPPGKEYERLSFPELVKEAKNEKPESVDSVLGIREV